MVTLGLFCLVLWCLYRTKLGLQRLIQAVSLLILGSKTPPSSLYSLLFFPGVITHELAHFLTASLLGVRTGEVALLPHELQEQKRVALGSVKIAKTDFVRGSLIGAAPLITGLILLYVCVAFYLNNRHIQLDLAIVGELLLALRTQPIQISILVLYSIWCLGNTLFLSKEDRSTWPVLIVVVGLMGIMISLAGMGGNALEFILPWVQKVAALLLVGILGAILVNLLALGFFGLVKLLLEKVLHKRVIYH